MRTSLRLSCKSLAAVSLRPSLRRQLLLNDVRSPRLTHVAVYHLLLKGARHRCLVLCDASTSAECFEASPPPLPRASCAGCQLLASSTSLSSTALISMPTFSSGPSRADTTVILAFRLQEHTQASRENRNTIFRAQPGCAHALRTTSVSVSVFRDFNLNLDRETIDSNSFIHDLHVHAVFFDRHAEG